MFASTQVMSAKSSATFGNAKALKAVKAKAVTPVSRGTVAMASADGMVPDMAKRTTMNLLLLGTSPRHPATPPHASECDCQSDA